jgi:serine/threonine protein kinase
MMVNGRPPSPSQNHILMFTAFRTANCDVPILASDQWRSLIQRLLVVVPSKRLTARQALSHSWVSCSSRLPAGISDAASRPSIRCIDEFFGRGQVDFKPPDLERQLVTSEITQTIEKNGQILGMRPPPSEAAEWGRPSRCPGLHVRGRMWRYPKELGQRIRRRRASLRFSHPMNSSPLIRRLPSLP